MDVDCTYSPVQKQKKQGVCANISKKYCCFLQLFMLISLSMLIAGIVLLAKKSDEQVDCKDVIGEMSTSSVVDTSYCQPSAEARRIKLDEFLEKCKQLYFKLSPTTELYFYQDAGVEELDRVARK